MRMETWLLAKRAQIISLEAEMQGYVALNQYRLGKGETVAYNEDAFVNLSDQLNKLAIEILNSEDDG